MTMKLQVPLDERVRARLGEGHDGGAATLVLQELGPEVFGFLVAALRSESDADEVFASTSERVWRSIRGFRWHCSLRTWVYVIARNELARFTEGARRDQKKRATPTELEGVVAAVRTETRSILRSEKLNKLLALRDELPVDDRALLVLRVDRDLSWEEIARTFMPEEAGTDDEAVKREAARLRKRFQLVRQRLTERAKRAGLIPA